MTAKVTTAGSLLIKDMLPTDEARKAFDPYSTLDKGGIKDLMVNIIKNGGDKSHDTISNMSNLFFNTATEEGYSTPLSDYENDSDERQALIAEYEKKVTDIMASGKSKKAKNIELHKLSSKMTPKIHNQNLNYLLQRGSTAAKMALTGARGNPTQLGQGTTTPLMAIDVNGDPIPVPIKKSFAEGLSPAEHLAMSYGGRSSTVKTQLSTALPGDIFKKLTPNLVKEVVTSPDCKTTNGVMIDASDRKALVGKYTARTNIFIDEKYYSEISKGAKTSRIKVRSVLTCESKDGVCQKCYGIASNGKLPGIGENVGVIAAQSVSEVLTQAVLSTKHSGGVAGKSRNAFDTASTILKNPENFQDKATISSMNGRVEKIEKTPLKDYYVTIAGEKHFVPKDQELLVKKNGVIRKGDSISTGVVNPREFVKMRGIGSGRKLMANSLRKVYEDDGHKLDPRHFDLVAKNLIKYVEVSDPGKTGFLPGQKVDVNDIESMLEKDVEIVPLRKAKGRVLSHKSLELTAGTMIDQNHIDDLSAAGVREVRVSKSGLVINPIVPGLQTAKLLDKNWVSKMSFTRLANTIKEAGALSEHADVHSTDPIASYMMGTEFGEGLDGKY